MVGLRDTFEGPSETEADDGLVAGVEVKWAQGIDGFFAEPG
jgi:hypothetical protein